MLSMGLGGLRWQAVRLDIAIAFPRERGIDQRIAPRLLDLARLARHSRDDLAVGRALYDHATALQAVLAGDRVDGVLVTLVAEAIGVTTRIAGKTQVRA